METQTPEQSIQVKQEFAKAHGPIAETERDHGDGRPIDLKDRFSQARQAGFQEQEPELTEKTALLLNELQSEQQEQHLDLDRKYYERIATKTKELETFYNLKDVQAEVSRLTEATAKPSLMQRMNGQAERDREDLAGKRKELENINDRIGTAIGKN